MLDIHKITLDESNTSVNGLKNGHQRSQSGAVSAKSVSKWPIRPQHMAASTANRPCVSAIRTSATRKNSAFCLPLSRKLNVTPLAADKTATLRASPHHPLSGRHARIPISPLESTRGAFMPRNRHSEPYLASITLLALLYLSVLYRQHLAGPRPRLSIPLPTAGRGC